MEEDYEQILMAVPADTSLVEECNNLGCGFNVEGKCTASGTGCFGYIGEFYEG